MSKKFYETSIAANSFSITLLRDALLPSLIGQEGDILYWAGKKIARQFVLTKDEEIPLFFKQAAWGSLARVKSKKNTQTFELTGPVIETRQGLGQEANFLLEAGFLAETIQNQLGHPSEAIVASSKKNSVTLLVKIDLETTLPSENFSKSDVVTPQPNDDEATELRRSR
ncbi:hypothetical protein LFYK43_22910 [Ligilactobacillus salitolerans]|uniref:DUF2507 domain-containing protein n=1 Tax=Ligilactobacillus salitolerans TaxID=1808352 RepID=A0A401IWD7_9LACO|nr:YslB family protein [Ligilactobacillus salitolerans]GBG95832.1 hypothetical protein LFYK43_22910 [Ligilactobacillus salitolerans]